MNPLTTDREFSLSLANPNPTSRRSKEGPVYRVSFELTREEWDWFMETETAGMVLECSAMVTHRNEPPRKDQPKEEKAKPGPLCMEAVGLCRRGDFYRFLDDKYPLLVGEAIQGLQTHDEAAICADVVCSLCAVLSRKYLDTKPSAAARFSQLKREFLEWQR